MQNVAGFPLRLPGREKYTQRDVELVNGDLTPTFDEIAGPYALAQHLEVQILEMSEADRTSGARAAAVLAQELLEDEDNLAIHIDQIHAVREDGREIEIEFTATGYPGRYVKRLSLDGPAGKHRCKHIP